MSKPKPIYKVYPFAGVGNPGKKYAKTGEYRAPKKGEYFLSGAIPEVYLAGNDMTVPYNIMAEVEELPRPPQEYKFKDKDETWSVKEKEWKA